MNRLSIVLTAALAGLSLADAAVADPFAFSAGSPDGKLAALSQPASGEHLATETADDFILAQPTTIAQASLSGLLPSPAALADITGVEVEIYHVFPLDSVEPPSGAVPARANSPADVEIDAATRDSRQGTLRFQARLLDDGFSVLNSVVDGINPMPGTLTEGEGPLSGAAVEITITFDPPIALPADHYFFRPQVEVTGGEFLFLSAPKPIVAPGTPFMGDLQAWIRNADLDPDWLRIGTDIIGGPTPPTFNMAFSLSGDAAAGASTPTPTATPQPTATATDPAGDGGGDGCNLGGGPAGRGFPWTLFVPAALLWAGRRRRRRLSRRSRNRRRGISRLVPIAALSLAARSTPAAAQCLGDFNGDFAVTVDELVTAVRNALDQCEFDGPRFVDHRDGTVTDRKTGLMWEKKDQLDGRADLSDPHDADNVYTWSGGDTTLDGAVVAVFLFGLNSGRSADGLTTNGCFAGHCDWRLPTIEELTGIIDPSQGDCSGSNGACVDPQLGLTQADRYWSATTLDDDDADAWFADFSGVQVSHAPKPNELRARAVRGGL